MANFQVTDLGQSLWAAGVKLKILEFFSRPSQPVQRSPPRLQTPGKPCSSPDAKLSS